jgi:ABC-type polysaccharide/polyol phosphate export permease
MIVTGVNLSIYILFAPIYLILLFLFSFGVSLMLATITVFFRDIEHIYSVFIMILQFASAIFYPASIIPDKYQFILHYNPVLYYIQGFRDIVYSGIPPSATNLLICIFISIISMVMGILVFEKNQNKFILRI